MGARKSGDFNPVRQGLFGLLGAAILLYPLWKNLSPWPEGTYGVLPFVYLGWIALGVGFLLWTRARRPDALGTVGSALAAVEEEAPPTTQVPAHGDSAKVQTGGPGLNLSPASPNPRRPSHPIPPRVARSFGGRSACRRTGGTRSAACEMACAHP